MSLYNYTIGFAYIALPNDIEREVYISDCYKNSWVSLIMEDGGFFNRVPISPEILSFIRFPLKPQEVGTPVLFGTDEIYKQPTVLTRLQERSELGDSKEHQFKFKRKYDDQLVEISGSAKTGQLNFIVNGATKPAKINVSVMSDKNDSELNLDVAGNVNVKATGSISLSPQKTFNSTTIDPESENQTTFEQTSTEHHFENKKLIINKGDDPLVLGNELKSFLGDFIDEVSKIKIATSIGLQPIVNKVQVIALKKKLNTFLSKVMFTDK